MIANMAKTELNLIHLLSVLDRNYYIILIAGTKEKVTEVGHMARSDKC